MVGIVTDPFYKEHLTGIGHPEQPGRIDAIAKALSTLSLQPIPARDATELDLLRCHTQSYLNTVKEDIASCQAGIVSQLSTGDTPFSSESLRVAIRAAGGVLSAVDAVLNGVIKSVFCLVRPPGHHAESNAGMGFCIFNNVAVGARYAQQFNGIERVAIVDWDVHHGNGTQEIFENDPTVFYFSTHQYPLYPGTGKETETGIGAGKGTTLNCPIPAGSGSKEAVYRSFVDKWVPAMATFKPDLVMISAGFDAHQDDPLGGLLLNEDDFGALTHLVKTVACDYAEGRVVSVLEGGYNLKALAASARAHVSALLKG